MRSPLALTLSMLALSASAAPSNTVDADHVSLALVSEFEALVPGSTARLGVLMKHEAHWHTYWINPGDSGLPTRLTWHLPDAFRAGEIAWPTPRRFTLGELYNFGYDGDVLLPVSIEIPASAVPDTTLQLSVDAKWLVCEEQCIPGKATLTLQLPVKTKAAPNVRVIADFARAGTAQPRLETAAKAHLEGERIVVTLPIVATPGGLDAFSITPNVVSNAPPQVADGRAGAVLTFAKSAYAASLPSTFDLLIVPPHGSATTAHVGIDDPNP